MKKMKKSNNILLKTIKHFINIFPNSFQTQLSKYYFYNQIKSEKFRSAEIEWDYLSNYIHPGDTCIDVGANIGRYTLKMSKLVGNNGLVISFEPLTSAFEMLTYFVNKGKYKNICLLNLAASESISIIDVETDYGNLNNPYLFETNTKTKISNIHNGDNEKKLAIKIDSLDLPNKIKIIKIDVEGHELEVCKGMTNLINRDHPILIIENNDLNIPNYLSQFGYECLKLSNDSRNSVYISKA